MKLSQLLSIYAQLKWGDTPHIEVQAIIDDSRSAQPGMVFVALRGTQTDSHKFLPKVCAAGVAAVVVESDELVPADFTGAIVVVKSTREALNQLAERFYKYPAKSMYCVGVTGTNGKTSVCYMVEKILSDFSWKVGVLGTVDHHIGERTWVSHLTTPGPLELQKRLAEFVSLGADAVVFEVSSHAIEQKRAHNIPFDVVVFTNLSRDHLDYHNNMDSYFNAKEKLFSEIPGRYPERQTTALINEDCEYGAKMRLAGDVRGWGYSQVGGPSSDFQFRMLEQSFAGCRAELKTPRGEGELVLSMIGAHNVYNAVAAIGVGLAAGISLDACLKSLSTFKGVPGRLQRVASGRNFSVFVDYAHTDEALRTVLKGLNDIRNTMAEDVNIITVFGCGGDRDPGKRSLMAKAALEYSDIVFITTDNPRTEDPLQIINDSLRAIPQEYIDQSVFVEQNRKQAILRAINSAKSGDVVLIAGKGHEDYQIIGTEKLPFDDVEVAKELLLE